MIDNAKSIWELIEEKGYIFDLTCYGWLNKESRLFISNYAFFHYPGDVRDFLITGVCRNLAIFDTGFAQPDLKDLGYRRHKDGKLVSIRRIK